MAGRRLTSVAATRLAASLLPLLSIVGYLLFWQLRFHDWSRPINLERTWWQRQFTLPWVTLWHGLRLAARTGSIGGQGWSAFDFVLVLLGLVLAVWVAVRVRPGYAAFTWGSIIIMLVDSWPVRPLAADPRYLVVLFPLVWALARLGRRPGWHEGIVAVSAASMAIVAWLFLTTMAVY